jgi:hypothetical protein
MWSKRSVIFTPKRDLQNPKPKTGPRTPDIFSKYLVISSPISPGFSVSLGPIPALYYHFAPSCSVAVLFHGFASFALFNNFVRSKIVSLQQKISSGQLKYKSWNLKGGSYNRSCCGYGLALYGLLSPQPFVNSRFFPLAIL